MSNVILSTIGTSLLTNQIQRSTPDEKDWYNLLRDHANLTDSETPPYQTYYPNITRKSDRRSKSK